MALFNSLEVTIIVNVRKYFLQYYTENNSDIPTTHKDMQVHKDVDKTAFVFNLY